MTKPINIYIISRICNEMSFNLIEEHDSNKVERKHVQYHEIESLQKLTNALFQQGVTVEMMDGFFYGYQIPQIAKEFDLLKFNELNCLNIEIKSQDVSEEAILNQLLRNKHYLKHLDKNMFIYSIITNTLKCYQLIDNKLKIIDFSEIVNVIVQFGGIHLSDIDSMFNASHYLISPLNTPDRFLNNEYFLTKAQEQIKKEILLSITYSDINFFCITGKPGTGKTLLTYDIAKSLSAKGKTVIIHCGILSPGQELLKYEIKNFDIISARTLKDNPNKILEYCYIFVDEAHRLYLEQYIILCKIVKQKRLRCIFSLDPEQILSKTEERRAIFSEILELPKLQRHKLTTKIRTNKELSSFIISLFNLNKKPYESIEYKNVFLAYANSSDEAKEIISYYREKGYVFINYSKSNYKHSPYSKYEEDFDTHHVIGQEFDNVLMVMDNSFYYDNSGELRAYSHPNPDYLYPNLLYQGITRVREKIAILVIMQPELFDKIAELFNR